VIPDCGLCRVGNAYRLDFPDIIAREFPEEFPAAWSATERVLSRIQGADLSKLAEHSPGLQGYDWTGYLQCSVARLTRVLRSLRGSTRSDAHVLDLGAYFGNAALMSRSAGYAVDAIDGYRAYAPALDRCVQLMTECGIRVRDFADCGFALEKIGSSAYDAVLCLGVIEHIPHTPRPLLESINRVLKPGGVLVIDTPNIAYLYSRLKLARG
jgi:2-polyprenyl-3-methyl-5-hydroxy-6-metoxy-1,4-benzoquinol methylase